jgi:succinoglycan biosynthesis protein ExoO
MNPKVSVIIPAYNTEKYISQAIESALTQTEQSVEVIVVNDASTDATLEVVKSFSDERLTLINNEYNRGAGYARNRAIQESRGEWVAVLDSDDWYAPERLEKLLQVAYKEDADLIADDLYCIQDGEKSPWSTWFRESGEQIEKIRPINTVYFVETNMHDGQGRLQLGITKPLFKRDFLVQHGIEYDETIKVAQDYWFVLRCLVNDARFVLVPEPYYFYRSREGSLVKGSQLARLNEDCKATLDFLQQELVKNDSKLVRALSINFAALERNRTYYRVVESLKHGALLAALIEMVYNPYFFIHFIRKLPKIMKRRVDYYILGNKYAYDIFYPRSKL